MRSLLIRSLVAVRLALLGLVMPLLGLTVSPVLAQSDSIVLTIRGDETPEALKRSIAAIEAGGRKVELRLAPPEAAKPAPPAKTTASPAAAPPQPGSAATRFETFLDDFADGFEQGNAAIPRAVELPGDIGRAWAANRNGLTGLSAGWRMLLILALALAAAALFRYATAGWFARRLVPQGPTFSSRLLASFYGLLQDAMTIGLALWVVRLLKAFWLPELDFAATTLSTCANGAAIGASYITVGRFLLAPGAAERRLLPLPRADRHFRIFAIYSAATPVVVTSAIIAERVAGSREAVAGLFAITGLAITLLKVWWFLDARHDLKTLVLRHADEPGPWLRVLAVLTPWVYIASAIFVWMVGRAAAMMIDGGRWAEAAGLTQIIIVLVPILAAGVSALIACRRAHAAEEAVLAPMRQAVSKAFQAVAAGAVWALGLYLIARIWAAFVMEVGSGQFGSLTRQAGGIAALAFAGWVVMVFLRALFDAYTPRRTSIGPADEEAAHNEDVPTRLATVLPVLRGVVLGAVAGLTLLVLLSRLGVDIGPLIAGFGILGLAISFGSQALVRDIVSGFFFMLEDAFRVGEYVDTGRLKGTVEKISLRSMQLRHQSGQIHTVPFGQIASLTNASRDWATVKFNVRLDPSVDIEKARKTIKKTGLALMEDPEFGPNFIAPLKMQGVTDIADTAIVVRLKFTAKPAQASTLQREALKRVYRNLIEAGVPFASNAVTVRGGEGNAPAGAAAITAIPPPSPLAPAG